MCIQLEVRLSKEEQLYNLIIEKLDMHLKIEY